jgi:hypothetical protein
MNESTCLRRPSRLLAAALAIGMAAATPSPLNASQPRSSAKNQGSAPARTGPLAAYEQCVAEFRADPAGHASHAARIAYADALLHLGNHTEAIVELYRTEASYPEAYLNAVYLGVASELAGSLDSARYWIAEGIRRNPDARSGSEWLHLAIVEARLALASDPRWLESHSVLENNTHRTVEAILGAIEAQLTLRAEYRMPADAVVCDLYFEAGVCASGQAKRREFFAQSLKLGNLRQSQIETQEKLQGTVVTTTDF